MKRIQLISFLASSGLLAIVLEMVRRKLLKERFAILWIFSALALVVFSLWGSFLEWLANIAGVYYAPLVIIPIIIFFGVLLALYFSVLMTKHDKQTRELIQKMALLENEVESLKKDKHSRAVNENND